MFFMTAGNHGDNNTILNIIFNNSEHKNQIMNMYLRIQKSNNEYVSNIYIIFQSPLILVNYLYEKKVLR